MLDYTGGKTPIASRLVKTRAQARWSSPGRTTYGGRLLIGGGGLMLDGNLQTGTFNAAILSTGEIVAVIPERSASALVALAGIVLAARRRRKA